MGDLPIPHNYDVEPPASVLRKLVEIRIQEYRSRIVRHKQDMEDLLKGKVKELETKITMLELSIKELEAKRDSVTVNMEE